MTDPGTKEVTVEWIQSVLTVIQHLTSALYTAYGIFQDDGYSSEDDWMQETKAALEAGRQASHFISEQLK